MKKNKTISFSKIITIFSIITVVCLSISMADLFSSLITVGGFTFTNNDIIFNKYNVYAISLASTDTNALAKQHSNSVKEQGGAGYIYLTNSKYHIVASIYENEADALKVQENLKNSHKNSEILPIVIPSISISNNLLAEEKTTLENSINIFKNSYKKLYDISVSLDTSVISEVNAKLAINELGSDINKITTNFITLFSKQASNNFLIIKLKLNELATCINNLIAHEEVSLTSNIKETYCNIIMLYKDLANLLNNSV